MKIIFLSWLMLALVGIVQINAEEVKKLNISSVKEIDMDQYPLESFIPEEILDSTKKKCVEPFIIRNAAKNWSLMNFTYETFVNNYGEEICYFDYSYDFYNSTYEIFEKEKHELDLRNYFSWDNPEKRKLIKLKSLILDYILNKHSSSGCATIGIDCSVVEAGFNYKNNTFFDLLPFPINRFTDSYGSSILLGKAGHYIDFHFHEETFLVEFYGKKLVNLASHENGKRLEAINLNNDDMTTRSKADVINPDFEKYPQLGEVQFFQAILNPGDVLYIPDSWYHSVHYLTDCIGGVIQYQ